MRTLRDIPSRPSTLVRAILHAYPRAWRERYELELGAMLASTPQHPGQLLDLIRGAVDARLHPGIALRPSTLLLAVAGPSAPRAARSYGAVEAAPVGELTRRSFLRRMVGFGAALLTLEFLGGTLAFLWPNITEGIGATFRVGTIADVLEKQPDFAQGWPYAYAPGRIFLINVPAARALALGTPSPVANPTANQLLALWRKCPHLGCQVPDLCDSVKRFHCRCHGSVYNIVGEKLKNGPAERGMDRFPVTIGDDGVIVIDTSQRITGPPVRGEDALAFHDAFPYSYTCDDA